METEGDEMKEDGGQEMGMEVRSRVDVYSKAGGKLMRKVSTRERKDAGTDRDVRPETDSYMRGLHPSGRFSSGVYTFPVLAERQLVIYENNGEYTMEFRELMRSFYLNI